MSVGDFLGFIAGMHGLSKRQANDRLAELVERIDLADVWNQRIESLSKGYKRRVGIADAIVAGACAAIDQALAGARGIAPEIRDKLFQPFVTTKPTGEGTGLGLSISYDIVTQQHGGSIEVDSAVDEFTEFTIRLPRR